MPTPDFVFDLGALPATKSDKTGVPGGEDPNKWWAAADANYQTSLFASLRNAVRSARWMGITDSPASPTSPAAGLTQLRSQGGKLQLSENGNPFANIKNVFDVRAYGAVGDDATDDTAAIQAANAACIAAGGGVVYFPVGTYKTTAPIAVGSGVVYRGESANYRSGAWIRQATAGQHVFTLAGGVHPAKFEHLTFGGRQSAGAVQTGTYGVAMSGAAGNSSYRIHFSNCWILNCERGISAVGTDNNPNPPNWQISDVLIEQTWVLECLRCIWMQARNADYWKVLSCSLNFTSGGSGVYIATGGSISLDNVTGWGSDGYVSPTGKFLEVHGPFDGVHMTDSQAEALAGFFDYSTDGTLPWACPDDLGTPVVFHNCINDAPITFSKDLQVTWVGGRLNFNIAPTCADPRITLINPGGSATADGSGAVNPKIVTIDRNGFHSNTGLDISAGDVHLGTGDLYAPNLRSQADNSVRVATAAAATTLKGNAGAAVDYAVIVDNATAQNTGKAILGVRSGGTEHATITTSGHMTLAGTDSNPRGILLHDGTTGREGNVQLNGAQPQLLQIGGDGGGSAPTNVQIGPNATSAVTPAEVDITATAVTLAPGVVLRGKVGAAVDYAIIIDNVTSQNAGKAILGVRSGGSEHATLTTEGQLNLVGNATGQTGVFCIDSSTSTAGSVHINGTALNVGQSDVGSNSVTHVRIGPGSNTAPELDLSAGLATFGTGVKAAFEFSDATGTPGDATINKASGRLAMAAGAGTVVLTNSLIGPNTVVIPIIEQIDGTFTFIKACVINSGAHTATITGNANATNATSIGFLLVN